MSSSVTQTQLPSPPGFTQSQASVLGPGIAGIFIQGIETGLVIAQFSQWFSRLDHNRSSLLSTVVIFVTVVGLTQSGICFASAWYKYVERFGMFLRPDWEDFVQPILTYVISFPVQALMMRRCYYLVSKNMFIIVSSSTHHREYAEPFLTQTPLVLLLVASIVMITWSMVIIVHILTTVPEGDWASLPQTVGIIWPYMMSLLLPSVLDLVLTGILLHYLIRTTKRVYTPHKRKRINRLVNIVWQSALPPTLCAICAFVIYILFSTAPRIALVAWFPVIQAMIGKLYVLSLFYMTNAQHLQPDERLTTLISTLTVPTEVMCTLTQNARVGDVACGEIAAERAPARTLDFACSGPTVSSAQKEGCTA